VLLREWPAHDFQPVGEKDERCVRVERCEQCRSERQVADHRLRTSLGVDVGHHRPCVEISDCGDCGERIVGWEEVHDCCRVRGQIRCSRCDELSDIGE